jgi:hypothetical protein
MAQMRVFYFSPWDKLWPPRGEVGSQGRSLAPRAKILCSPLHSSKEYSKQMRECLPLGGKAQPQGRITVQVLPQLQAPDLCIVFSCGSLGGCNLRSE